MKQDNLSWDKWIEKDRDAEEGKQWVGTKRRKTASVIANDGCLHCLALLHGGGFDQHILFLANVHSKGTSQTFSPPHCYSRPPLLLRGSPVYFSTLAHSSLSTAPTSLIFHLITYSFKFIFQAEKDLRERSWKQLAQGWSLSGSAWTWGRGDHWTLQSYSKDKRLEVIY